MADAVDQADTLIAFTADIVSAHVSNNQIPVTEVADLIRTVHDALGALSVEPAKLPERGEPAVPVRFSIKPDYLICLEDGKKLKMLKRHLATRYDLTPDQYRRRWNLPADYPMVAPAYADTRRMLAKKIGLGTLPRKR
jgi:predicted transcriptional regulator